MTEHGDLASADSATETHHEPHGAAAPHGPADDVPEHEADDAAGHASDAGHDADEEIGPIDVSAWAAGAAGVALGLIVVACLVLATSTLPG